MYCTLRIYKNTIVPKIRYKKYYIQEFPGSQESWVIQNIYFYKKKAIKQKIYHTKRSHVRMPCFITSKVSILVLTFLISVVFFIQEFLNFVVNLEFTSPELDLEVPQNNDGDKVLGFVQYESKKILSSQNLSKSLRNCYRKKLNVFKLFNDFCLL